MCNVSPYPNKKVDMFDITESNRAQLEQFHSIGFVDI